MIYSELKDFEEILKLVKDENSLFLIGCNGCAEVCKTGGSEVVEEISEKLKEAGKGIKGKVIIDFLCSKNLIVKKMRFYLNEIMDSSAILVFSCGIGVQCVSAVVDKPVYPATNTVYLVRELKKEIPWIQTVEIGTEMWKLSLICEKVKNLLIVDAVNYGEKPGSCYLFSEFEISDFSFSLHDKNFLSEILILKKLKGYPENFYIFGIEPFPFLFQLSESMEFLFLTPLQDKLQFHHLEVKHYQLQQPLNLYP